ncbi:MAG TPA: sensory rhodopsin transducer [Steroidobacteraceae bacterium]|nr:sensory rhodopsin transducer [Steroidobacteraceae bacterium]
MSSSTDRPAAIGKTRWAIAEGYIPRESGSQSRELVSHEAICVLNAGDAVAHLRLHIYFTDREPAGPYHFEVPARRTLHLRLNDLKEPEPVPLATEYSMLLESDQPVVAQHTRLDSRQHSLALLSTIAYGS